MLAETYEKFKSQLKAQKTGNEQLPEVVQTSDEQVHYICSYNHYPVKGDDIKSGLIHNDIYNTDELTHEFEYGLFKDIIKSEQLMADLKQIDEYEESIESIEEIKQLLVKPPVLRMLSGEGIFCLESDTSRTATGGTLYQWQDNQWVLVGYHSTSTSTKLWSNRARTHRSASQHSWL